MENHYPPVIEKSIKVIQRFEEKFGWFVIRVYQFPQVEGFGTFLESVQRTLLRHGTAVWYIWAKIRGTDKILLIYFGRGLWAGHFEQETDAIIPRLWQRQASVPYMALDMAGAILSVPAIEFGKLGDKALMIEAEFGGEDEDEIGGYFLLIPTLESYAAIMSSLGL